MLQLSVPVMVKRACLVAPPGKVLLAQGPMRGRSSEAGLQLALLLSDRVPTLARRLFPV
jgi:hypothetical protein